jgi:hypothetical protein
VADAAAALSAAGDGLNLEAHANRLYSAVLGRLPSSDELQLAGEFLATNPVHQFAQVLLMSNELMFVD